MNTLPLLKWLTPVHPELRDRQFAVVDRGAIIAEDSKGCALGLTIFECGSMNTDLIERLRTRARSAEFAQAKFKIVVPPRSEDALKKLLQKTALPNLSVVASPYLRITNRAGQFQVRTSVRVVNVDDSPVLLKMLRHTFGTMPGFEVIQQISNPMDAADQIRKLKPDLVTMDIQMPGKSGVEVVRELNGESLPILVVSSLNLEDGSEVFDALNSGAFDYVRKPKFDEQAEFKAELEEKSLIALSGSGGVAPRRQTAPKQRFVTNPSSEFDSRLVWCIGSSTGGTQALTRIFTSLPAKIPPTVIVQHIPPVFSKAFAQSLNNLVPFEVSEAVDGEPLQPNHVYIAPGGMQMAVVRRLNGLFISIRDDEPVNRFKPSVDYLFRSLNELSGTKFVAGVLTGMGRDGANGLLDLKKSGARTFVQDEASSAVFGMPRAAYEIGAADEIVPLDEIAETMLKMSLTPVKKTA